MARAAGSNTKFASVNLNKSYGKPTAGAISGYGSGSGGGTLGSLGRAARTSSHGGMLLLARPGPAASVQKGGKIIVPRPVNLPSLKREHAGNDPSIALVGGSSGWTKAPPQEEAAAAASILSETTGMGRLAPALSAGSTWGTSSSLSGQPAGESLSGEQWPVLTQAGVAASNQAAVERLGVYTPPRARAMQTTPLVMNGHAVLTVEKAVVLRREDFPTLQAALPPPPVPAQQRQKALHQKQREKHQELKDQQQKLQLLSEQLAVLKSDEVLQSQLGGPQLQLPQRLTAQTRSDQIQKDAAQVPISKATSKVRPTSKADSYSYGPPSPGARFRRQSNWTDDERDPTFRPQGGSYSEWSDRSDRESEPHHVNRAGENFGYGRSLPSRDVPFLLERDCHVGKVAEGRENKFNDDNAFGREPPNTGYVAETGFSRSNTTLSEGGFREWGGGIKRESCFGGWGVRREGSRDVASNRESGYEKEVGYASSGREFSFSRDNFFSRDNGRMQCGEYDACRGRFGGNRFIRNGVSGGFSGNRGFLGQKPAADGGSDWRGYEGCHFNGPYGRSIEEIHGLVNFRPSQGVGIDPPVIPMLGRRRKKGEAKELIFRDEEREAFEAELERVQKTQELDRQRKLEEKEHAVEMAQKDLEERERQVREEEETQAKMEEAKVAAVEAEREALVAAQKVEDERKAREEDRRQMQLEEERRKENARRKLLELEERIAKRVAENQQQEDARLNVEGKSVNMWQRRKEEEVRRREVVEREDERIVRSTAGYGKDDDDRAPPRPSGASSHRHVSQRTLQNDILPLVKLIEVQTPSGESTARGAEFRNSTSASESERRTFVPRRREQSADNVIGSAAQFFPPYDRDEHTDFQPSISRNRGYNGRGYGDREESFNGLAPNNAGFVLEECPGEFSQRPHFTHFEGGFLDISGDLDDRRWGTDRIDRWRSGLEDPGQRPSPPQTPPYFHGSDATEPSSYGRLRQSLPKQPRVPPPPARVGPLRSSPGSSSEQTFIRASSQAMEEGVSRISSQEEIMIGSKSSFPSQEGKDDKSAKESGVKITRADLQQEDAPQQQYKAWGSTQRAWQQFSTSTLVPQRFFVQVSQGLSHGDLEVQPPILSQERNSNMRDGHSSLSSLTQSQEEAIESGTAVAVSEIDKQEMHVPSEDQNTHGEDDEGPTDDEEVEDEDQEGDEEGYEGYDEDEDEDADEDENEEGYEEGNEGYDEEGEVDEVDGERVRVPEQGTGRTEIALEGAKDEGFTVTGYEGIIEVGGGTKVEDDQMVQDKSAEHVHTGQSQMTETMQGRLLSQEEAEQSCLRSSVTGSTTESDAYLARQAPSQQSQPTLSFMAFSMPHDNVIPVSSSELASIRLPDLRHPSEAPVAVQFGVLPGISLLQESVPAIQIGSIQMPLHVPPHIGLQQVSHLSPPASSIQFGQLGHPPSPLQSRPNINQSTLAANLFTGMDGESSDSESANKVSSHEQQFVVSLNASVQEQPGKDSITLQSRSPWISQLVSLDVKGSVEVETRETRFAPGKPGQRPERRLRDRGVAREGLSNITGSGAYFRIKSSRRGSNNQSLSQESAASQGSENFGGRGRANRPGSASGRGGFSHSRRYSSQSSYFYTGADGAVLRPCSNRRNNFHRTDVRGRDPAEQLFDVAGGRSFRQTVNFSPEILDASLAGIDDRGDSRDTGSQLRDRSYSENTGLKFRVISESASSSQTLPRSEPTSVETFKKNGSGTSEGLAQSSESLLGKYPSEATPDASLQSGVVHVFKQPGIERGNEDDFIEVRSKRQMLNDRRAEREKEIKSKTNLKAKEQAARKQSSAKSGLQVEGFSGQGSKSSDFVDKRTSSRDTVCNSSRIPQSGITSAVIVAPVPTVPGSSQVSPAPIGTSSGGLSDKRTTASKLRLNPACGGSLADGEIGAVAATSDSQGVHQEGMSGTPIAWGGTHSRQVVSLTQIQLEEAMKPARYEAPVSQQLQLEERGNMVLDPGTTVASKASKDKLSASATGPIGPLLAGDKIQFGAVTSPPLGVSNSRPLTPALISAVGSSLGSHVDGGSDKNDLKKSKHISSSERVMPTFPTKGKRSLGQEEIEGSSDEGVDAEAEAEAAASAVAVAAISSDESVCSTRGPISVRKSSINSSFGSVTSTTNHSGLVLGNSVPVCMQPPMLEDSMAAVLPADLSVEPTSISIRGAPGKSSSLLSSSGQSPFSGLEMSQMLGFSFVPSKDVSGPQGSNDQGVPSAVSSGGAWQPQHSGVDSFYRGPPPSGYTGQYINSGAGHMLVYTNPFSAVGPFGQLGFMGPTYLPSGKQPDWKHTPVWSAGPVVGMSTSDSRGGITGAQRGCANIQQIAPGPVVMPVTQSLRPFDLNLSAPFQIPNVESSPVWSHLPAPLYHVPISMGNLQQSRRGSPQGMENAGGFDLGLSPHQVNNGNFTSTDAAAQFPDELGLGDASSSIPSTTSPYAASQNLGRSPISNQAASISASGNSKLRNNRRSARVTRRGNLLGTGNGSITGSVNLELSVKSDSYNNAGADGSRVLSNHMQSQAQHQAIGVGHTISYSDQRGPRQQNSPRVGSANNWSGLQGHRKGGGSLVRSPIGERWPFGEKIFAPPSKLKQVYVAKLSSSPSSGTGTAVFNATGGQAAVGL